MKSKSKSESKNEMPPMFLGKFLTPDADGGFKGKNIRVFEMPSCFGRWEAEYNDGVICKTEAYRSSPKVALRTLERRLSKIHARLDKLFGDVKSR